MTHQSSVSSHAHKEEKKKTHRGHDCKYKEHGSVVALIAPKIDGLINILSKDRKVAKLQSQLKDELRNIEGLQRVQLFCASHMFSYEICLLRVFFAMNNEKKEKKLL